MFVAIRNTEEEEEEEEAGRSWGGRSYRSLEPKRQLSHTSFCTSHTPESQEQLGQLKLPATFTVYDRTESFFLLSATPLQVT